MKRLALSTLVIGLSLCGTPQTFANTDSGASTQCFSNHLSEEFGITGVPRKAEPLYKKTFCKYIAFVAPNGKPIEIYAQTLITDEQLIRAYNILEFYLQDTDYTRYGSSKKKVANAMSNNKAKLLLMNGSDDGRNPIPDGMNGQPLYQTELVVEGTPAYINNDYERHRDASFEEILHMVHDYGIGTSTSDVEGAKPKYTSAIDKAMQNAMQKSIWPTANVDEDTRAWIKELTAEGSLSQEYLASVIDSYYGYWGAFTEAPGGMHGIYIAKTRKEMKTKDPIGKTLADDFFSPVVTYLARIDKAFKGEFSLSFDSAAPYTYKSQYLVNAQLTGNLDSNLTGNDFNNILIGNAGVNTIDGRDGEDLVVFEGAYDEYYINPHGKNIQVGDSVPGRDGITYLTNVEVLLFDRRLFEIKNNEIVESDMQYFDSEYGVDHGAQGDEDRFTY